MRLGHFEAFRPCCPACLGQHGEVRTLLLTQTVVRHGDDVVEGLLQCPSPACLREYPVIDGIPLLVADVRGYLASQLAHIRDRDDLSPLIEGLVGEGAGPGSALDVTRTHFSTYTWDHYGDRDPGEAPPLPGAPVPGAIVRVLDHCLALAGGVPSGPLLDVGCSVGRATFELAGRTSDLVLGVDLGFHKLRMASRALRLGRVRYPRRRVGVLYDWRDFEVAFEGAERVDFWACDAAFPPLPPAAVGGAVGLNVIDCVHAPLDLLRAMRSLLREGGTLVLASPYDWSPAATVVEAWIGGHSPRSAGGGASDAVLRALLTPGGHQASVEGLALRAEGDGIPWTVRMHERSTVTYRVHAVVATRTA